MEHNLHTRKLQIFWRSHEGRLSVHASINLAALALTPPLHLQYGLRALPLPVRSGEKKDPLFVLLCAHRRAGMPEKKTGKVLHSLVLTLRD
jgi:hypothetical protein